MELGKSNLVGIIIGIIIIGISFFFSGTNFFFLIIGIGVVATVIPFVLGAMRETRISNEKEEMFLEFSRNLVESVKAGTPISKSIINVKKKSYGVLSDNVEKLANQMELGIPLNMALQIFAKDLNDANPRNHNSVATEVLIVTAPPTNHGNPPNVSFTTYGTVETRGMLFVLTNVVATASTFPTLDKLTLTFQTNVIDQGDVEISVHRTH